MWIYRGKMDEHTVKTKGRNVRALPFVFLKIGIKLDRFKEKSGGDEKIGKKSGKIGRERTSIFDRFL